MSYLMDRGDASTGNGPALPALTRRWTVLQARDLHEIYQCIAALILHCDVSKFAQRKALDVGEQLAMPPEMEMVVFGDLSRSFFRECVWAISNISGISEIFSKMLRYLSFENSQISLLIIGETLIACAQQSPNDLKQIFVLWSDFMGTLNDSFSQTRIDWLLDGTGQEMGLLQLIESNHESDSRRVYNMIKFLAHASASCPLMKDALNNRQEKWQWAVIWLQKQMEEHEQQSSSNSASTTFATCSAKFLGSNEDSGSSSRSFQRTVSAQKTLETARDLLTEFDNGSGGGCNLTVATAIQRVSSPDSCVIEIGNSGSAPASAVEDCDQRMDEAN